MKLGFAGTPQFAVPALKAVSDSRHELNAVFTQPDRPAGRGRSLHVSAVKQQATLLGLPVHQPRSFKTEEAAATLRGLDLDALVVVAYGQILPAAALAIPRLGCFNIHASLLPRWRGAAPIQRALLAGDSVTGVTIMRMEAALDTGPMLAVQALPIAPGDTAGTLHDRLAELGAALIVETLDSLAAGVARETVQSAAGVSYAPKIDKSEAPIDWRDAADRILLKVRAFNPWPIAETRLHGTQLRIWDAEPVPPPAPAAGAPPGLVLAASDAGIDVACGRGALRILKLQLPGRKALPAREFINAHTLDGARFESA